MKQRELEVASMGCRVRIERRGESTQKAIVVIG